jgi:GDPmannose 4,6-dehydratase
LNVLITGVSGFVGPHLARLCRLHSHSVYGIVRSRADRTLPRRLYESYNDIILHEGDITDVYALNDIVEKVKPDWVFHLASQSFVPYSTTNPLDTERTNIGGTCNLLEVLRKRAPKAKLIFAGSSEEYGKQYEFKYPNYTVGAEPEPDFGSGTITEFPINEQNALRPNTLYGVTKVTGDLMCQTYTKTFGLHTVISRAFNHEGWGRGPSFVTSRIIMQLCAIKDDYDGQGVLKLGDLTACRDWSHVDDICQGYLLMAEKGAPGRVYVQGSGTATSVQEFLDMAVKIIKPGVVHIDDSMPKRPAEIPYLRADPSRIKSELGWAPRKGLTDIIEDMYEYYKIPENRANLMI